MAEQSRGVFLNQVNKIDASDGEPDVDIIAVHGLDTKSPDTWTWRSKERDKPDVNWLADANMLPDRVKRVRIFTCDWPADLLQGSDSIPWTIGEFSRRLLAGIHHMRLRLATDGRNRDRPIIFIASCLGGIILMEALVMSDNLQNDYTSIRKATRGIIFLATPFRGTSFQDIAVWAEPMLKTWASLQNRSISQLLDSVKGSTFELEQLVRTFTRLCQDKHRPCKVHTFYETHETILQSKFLPAYLLPLFGQKKLLVNRTSATLDIDSDPLRLDRRHVMMNKFSGPQDLDYDVVAGKLDELVHLIRGGSLQQADAWIRDNHYTAERLQIERLSGQKLPMDQCYINLAIVERPDEKVDQFTRARSSPFSLLARQKAKSRDETGQVELTTVFNERKGRDGCVKHPRRILIRGRAGVGKTTLCKKIVYEFYQGTWSEWNNIFDRILWVPLRNLKLQERRRPGYNYDFLFRDEYFSLPDNRPNLAQALSKALAADSGRTLFLLDGLDEVSEYLGGENAMSLFLEDLLKQRNVIITSRPSAKPLSDIDLELETIGFYANQVEAYIDADPQARPRANQIKSFLADHWLLQGLMRIPIQLDALCYTWDDFRSGSSLDTMTGIYQAIEQKLWGKDAVRLERLCKGTLPPLPTELKNAVKYEMEILEFLAFNGMYSDIIDFTSAHRDKIVQIFPSRGLLLNETLGRLSFLRASDSSSNIEDKSYHFIHLTFQEYFAARYFVHNWTFGEHLSIINLDSRQKRANVYEADADKFLRDEKYNARYDIFWRFVAGLLDDNQLCRFFCVIEDQPRDLLGPVHQRLVMHCLSEVVPSDGMESFITIRVKLEEQLSQWLEFECDFQEKSRLASENEFPERSLSNVLQRASEAVRIKVLKSLLWRSNLPWSTMELISDWLGCNPSQKLRVAVLDIMLHHHECLSPGTLNAVVKCLDNEDTPTRMLVRDILHLQRTLPKDILKAITARFEHRDISCRRIILHVLRGQLPEDTLKTIAARLGDQNPRIRQKALSALRGPLPEDIIVAIAKQLKDPDPDVRLCALKAFRDQQALPEDILKCMVAQLQDQDTRIQDAVLNALQNQATLSEEILKTIAVWLVIEAKYTKLLFQPGLQKATLRAAIIWLTDQDENIKKTAIELLRNQKYLSTDIINNIAPHLWSQDRVTSLAMCQLLLDQQEVPEEILQWTVGVIQNPPKSMQLGMIQLLQDKEALPGYITRAVAAQLQNQDHDLQLAAIQLLRNQQDLPEDILEVIASKFEDESKEIKGEALNALILPWSRQFSSNDICRAIATQLTDQDEYIKKAALKGLSNMLIPLDNIDILNAIAGQLNDQHPEIICSALLTLGKQPQLPTDILKDVAAQLKDQHIAIRAQAARTLGNQSILSNEILKALAMLLEDEYGLARLAAAEALCRRSLPEETLEAITARLTDHDIDVRRTALKALQGKLALPEQILEAVIPSICDKDNKTRNLAVRVLGDQSALPEEIFHGITARLENGYKVIRQEVAETPRCQSALPEQALQAVTKQFGKRIEGVRWALVRLFRRRSALPDTLLTAAALYRGWLAKSFEEHVSCYVADGISYLDMPVGLGKVSLKGQPEEFMNEVGKSQKELGIPPQVDLRDA